VGTFQLLGAVLKRLAIPDPSSKDA